MIGTSFRSSIPHAVAAGLLCVLPAGNAWSAATTGPHRWEATIAAFVAVSVAC